VSVGCSNGKVETTASESLLGTGVLVDGFRVHAVGSFALHLLTAFLLVVLALHVLKFASEALDFVLVLIDLSLVHVEFSSHGLHLVGLLLKVLLVDGELLGNFWTRLSSQEVLQLNVELLLLRDHDVLLNDLLSLLDETLLKSLNLLEQLPSVGVGTLKLSPSVVVQGVFKFFRESLNLEALVQELLMERKGFLLEFLNLRGLGLNDLEFAGKITNLELE